MNFINFIPKYYANWERNACFCKTTQSIDRLLDCSPGKELIWLIQLTKREVFWFLSRNCFSGLFLQEIVDFRRLKRVDRMPPESEAGELFDGELGVEAVLDAQRGEHEVQHGLALLSVPAGEPG